MTDQDLRRIAAQAWDQIKDPADPPFAKCALDHQSRLAYKVDSVVKTGTLEDDFDRAVHRILNPPPQVETSEEPQPEAATAETSTPETPKRKRGRAAKVEEPLSEESKPDESQTDEPKTEE